VSKLSCIVPRLFLLLFVLAQPQENTSISAGAGGPAFRFERPVGSHSLTEALTGLSDALNKPNAMLAVRVCSQKPLAETLAIATAPPIGIHEYMVKAGGYSPERITLLRAEDCISRDPKNAATELWVVPQGGAIPVHTEQFEPCRVNIQSMLTTRLGESGRDYKSALSRLVNALRKRPQAFGVVNGFYYPDRQRPSLKMSETLREARKVLRRSKISPTRYLVRLKPWNEDWSPQSTESTYPAILVIEVDKMCK
jgi:hypothetical protein